MSTSTFKNSIVKSIKNSKGRTTPQVFGRWGLVIIILAISIVQLFVNNRRANAQAGSPVSLLMPIGGGYSESLQNFSAAAIANHHRGFVNIVVLPITMASDPESITLTERQQILQVADTIRAEIEASCQQEAGFNYICSAVVAPVLTREDAQNSDLLEYFNSELSAIFIPDGAQDIATHVIGGTLIEGALVRSHQQNVLIAGTGGGGALQSVAMLVGYKPGYNSNDALNYNAVEVWGDAEKHGLLFGFQHEILDTAFYEDGNLGRLLNAISQPDFPHLGIGIDSGTGANAPDGKFIQGVFGRTGVLILDAETYNAALGVQYIGCGDTQQAVLPCTPLLSLRNVLVQILAPGEYSYDLFNREHSLAAPDPLPERDFSFLQIPAGSGPLLLSGGLGINPESSPVISRFQELSEAGEAEILILTVGYSDDNQARAVSQRLAAAFNGGTEIITLSGGQSLEPFETSEFAGILVTAPDPESFPQDGISPVISAWQAGTPLLLDDAAATWAGLFHASNPISGESRILKGPAASRGFLTGQVDSDMGLRLLPITVESRLMIGNRWGRLFSLAYNHPEYVAVGLNQGVALEINQDGTRVVGDRTLITLDLRNAVLDSGENQAFVIANGLLDVFAPGETVQADLDNLALKPAQASTPILVTATATPLPTATITASPTVTLTPTPTKRPTRTPRPPRPTATPPHVPPPSNPNMNQFLITFGTLIIIIIILGMLLNRRRFG